MREVIGDILTPVENPDDLVVVCHQVNCMGVMGAGLAKQVRDRYPGVYRAYKELCDAWKGSKTLLGHVQFCSVLADAGYTIANVFGQLAYGTDRCHTDYGALRAGLHTVADFLGGSNGTVRIPYKMGCGLGGGDWDTVLGIIRETLANADVEIWRLQ